MIEYDDMNNPKRIQFTNGNVTKYIYSATGEKLRTIYQTAVPNITVAMGSKHELTDAEVLYKDSVDYYHGGKLTVKNGRLDKCYFDGGYAQAYNAFLCVAKPSFIYDEEPTEEDLERFRKMMESWRRQIEEHNNTDAFSFHYYTADHLGNIREVVNESGEVEQITNYYPFGTPFAAEAGNTNPDLQNHKYNGKEFDTMHGLNTYDYGARQYNSLFGRWDRMDPLCEKYYSISPYAYCANNPVLCIDEKGEEVKVYVGTRNNPQNRNLYSLGTRLAAHDNPNSIMIVAHGEYAHEGDYGMSKSILFEAYNPKTDSWNTTEIHNGAELNKFLSANSQVWKDVQSGKKDASDVQIVFYSCGAGDVARKISTDENFKGVTFIAPSDKVRVTEKAADVSVGHIESGDIRNGTWNTYKNGNLQKKYSGDENLLPGTLNFNNDKWWEVWKW